jgi:hypothetical protein
MSCTGNLQNCHNKLHANSVNAGTRVLSRACSADVNNGCSYTRTRGLGGLEVACWHLVPKFAGSHPAEAVGFLGLYFPSFGEEVKPSVPCRSFAACKRSLNVTCKSTFWQNYWTFLAHSSTFRRWMLSRGGESCNV